jgi:hypothetical protein
MTIQTITSVGQKRSYPVARNLAARTTFSDADAAQVVDAYTSFAAAEKKVMTAVRSADAPAIVLAGQAQPMHDSLVKFQSANQVRRCVADLLGIMSDASLRRSALRWPRWSRPARLPCREWFKRFRSPSWLSFSSY